MKQSAHTIAKRSAAIRAKNDARIALMHADYMTGLSLEEVGARHGLHMSSVWKFFQTRGLARRSKPGPEAYAKIAGTRRATRDAQAAAMHALYVETRSLGAVARQFASDKGTVRDVLERNGYPVRAFKLIPRQANGSPVRYAPKTAAELDAMVASATEVKLPAALKFEWRRWPMARRMEFIARLRAKVASPRERPADAFSANVEPFEYGHARAHAIVDRLNVGRDSRTKEAQLKPGSQGVIYRGALYYWAADSRGRPHGAYYTGKWTPAQARPALHRVIWEETHGRPLPSGSVVRHIDGNLNNLDPANLALATRNELARENQAIGLTKKSRALTALLLNRSQNKTPHELTIVKSLRHQKHR